jgi:hypothetical protein
MTVVLLMAVIIPTLLIITGIIIKIILTKNIKENEVSGLWYLIMFRPFETLWKVTRGVSYFRRFPSKKNLAEMEAIGQDNPGIAAELIIFFIAYVFTTSLLTIISYYTESFSLVALNITIIPYVMLISVTAQLMDLVFKSITLCKRQCCVFLQLCCLCKVTD